MLTVCYKTKVPTVYNKGTKWESQCDTFLQCELHGFTRGQAAAKVKEMNENKPENVEYYFLHEQPAMDTSGN